MWRLPKLARPIIITTSQKFTEHLHKLRLDLPTGVDITASSGNPIIYKPSSKYWHNIHFPHMAWIWWTRNTIYIYSWYTNAVAKIMAGWWGLTVSAIEDYGVVVKAGSATGFGRRYAAGNTCPIEKECLAVVVDSVHGTATKFLFDSVYSISGKTGTAVTAFEQ